MCVFVVSLAHVSVSLDADSLLLLLLGSVGVELQLESRVLVNDNERCKDVG